jgi:hypothetical protein
MITRAEVLIGLTHYYEQGDLSFIDTVNNISYGYKRELKTNLTKQNNEQKRRVA